MVAARNGWEIKSDDVTSAFLQSIPIDGEMFINIPSERKIPGVMYGKLISQSLGRWMQAEDSTRILVKTLLTWDAKNRRRIQQCICILMI